MSIYKAPLKDMQFAIEEILDFNSHYESLLGSDEVNSELVMAILEEAAKFSETIILPLNDKGDRQGCRWEDGQVFTPDGFKQAYDQYVEGGWIGMTHSSEYSGQDLPYSISSFAYEILVCCNHAWSMYGSLTGGAITTIEAHASEELKQRYLPKMVEGRWSGTMCLTEAHCGSDLGLLRTKAEPNEDGSYNITGSKIFISSGDHQLTENIVHIVLARLPDAPEGVKGISLFIVPKMQVNADSSLGQGNNVNCGSIEHKMGIHGNSTCVINFDGAKGHLIGPPHKGMRCMFTFINESRLGVAQQGHAHIEGSFQNALAYAKDRIQMRAPVRKNPDKPADPIIVHPDIRRMLLMQKAFAEGGRLLTYFCAKQVDITRLSDDANARETAETLLALLTPIAKGFLTEVSLEATSNGIQVLGGHGYISEWGQEQHYRDARISTIYEGTTGIQALDLLGRKILGSQGRVLEPFTAITNDFCAAHAGNRYVDQAKQALDLWLKLIREIGEAAKDDPNEVNAAAYDHLMLAGYAIVAYFWAESAVVAEQKLASGTADNKFYQAKLDTADYYFQRIMPRIESLAITIRSGADNLLKLEDESFVF